MEPVQLPKFTSGRRDLNPRNPVRHKVCELRSVRSEAVIYPLPLFRFATVIWDYGFCWGLVED
jgi:hypothetical protein